MKIEDKIHLQSGVTHLSNNPSENYFKGVKAVAQAFMLSDDVVIKGVKYTPASKPLGTGVYQLSYKKVNQEQIKV